MSSRQCPERIGVVLRDLLRSAEHHHSTLRRIQGEWKRVVGRSLAAHTRPVSLRRGRLVVQVDRPGDGFALSFERPRVLMSLRQLASEPVEELVMRPGEPPNRRTVR